MIASTAPSPTALNVEQMENALFVKLGITPLTKVPAVHVIILLVVLAGARPLKHNTVCLAMLIRACVFLVKRAISLIRMVLARHVMFLAVLNVARMEHVLYVRQDITPLMKVHALNVIITLVVLEGTRSQKPSTVILAMLIKANVFPVNMTTV